MEDIFELAKAKKLFGGGGGKREGTAIPVGQAVEKIYFNTNNTIEETNAILSQLTFVDLGFGSPMCLVYANTIDGDVGNYIAVSKNNGNYDIMLITSITQENGPTHTIYSSTREAGGCNGWINAEANAFYYQGAYWSQRIYFSNAMEMLNNGENLTDFQGVPIGAENEKIKNVLSITPF